MKVVGVVSAACLLLAAGAGGAQRQTNGEPGIISRDYIQEELKLSADQKQTLQKQTLLHAPDGPDRLWAFLKETLNAEQFKRFEQLELQHEGPPALMRPEVASELKITDDQRRQFMGLVQELQRKIEPLIRESRSSANPAEIRLKVIALRQACLADMEALMSDAQKAKWLEMLGRPFDTLGHH